MRRGRHLLTWAAAELSSSSSTASTETPQHIGAGSWLFTAQHSKRHAQPDPHLFEGCTKGVKVCQHSREACPTTVQDQSCHQDTSCCCACWQGRWHISKKRGERRWWKALGASTDSTSVNIWDARRSRLRAAGPAQPYCKEHARWRPCALSLWAAGGHKTDLCPATQRCKSTGPAGNANLSS